MSCDTRVTVVVAKMSLLLDRSQLVYLATSLLDLTTREALMSVPAFMRQSFFYVAYLVIPVCVPSPWRNVCGMLSADIE